MAIIWNRVTWYSKALAVVLFLATFAIAFGLGMRFERTQIESSLSGSGAALPGTAGAHCGGFIKDAPTCASGFHCVLKVSNPDTGGICVAD